jgi:hypothetical protein
MDLAVALAFVAIAARFRLQPSRSFDPWLLVVFFPLIVLVNEAGHAVAAIPPYEGPARSRRSSAGNPARGSTSGRRRTRRGRRRAPRPAGVRPRDRYARTWRFGQDQRWIDLARRADPNCSLLGRAQGELEAVQR